MSSAVGESVLVDVAASDFAFRTGQLIEQLLLDRSVDLALQAGVWTVTREHVESCLDRDLLDQLLVRVREDSHDGNAGEGGIGDGEPREAA